MRLRALAAALALALLSLLPAEAPAVEYFREPSPWFPAPQRLDVYWTPLGQPYFVAPELVYRLLRGHDPYPPPPLWAAFPEVPAAWEGYVEVMYPPPEIIEPEPVPDEREFPPPAAYKGLAAAPSREPGERIAAADINRGRLDLFTIDENLTAKRTARYGTGEGTAGAISADFDGDGIADLAAVNYFEDSMTVVLREAGGGERAFAYSTGSGPSAVAAADFNGDGIPDLVIANSGADNITVFLGIGNGGFAYLEDYKTGAAPKAIAAADINGDGIPDLITANFQGRSVSFLAGNGDGTFNRARDYPAGGSPKAIAAADFDKDGFADVAVTDWLGNKVFLLMGNGNGGFRLGASAAAGHTPASLTAADLDLDGNTDLVVSSVMEESVGVLFGKGDGTFRPYRELGSFSAPRAVAVRKLNLDRWPDIAVTDEEHESLSFVSGGKMAELEVSFDPRMGVVKPARGSYRPGTVVKLDATAKPGYRFVGWKGPVKEKKLPVTTLKIKKNEKIKAAFAPE